MKLKKLLKIPEGYYRDLARIESNNDTTAVAKKRDKDGNLVPIKNGAAGLFQFLPSTWEGEVKELGKSYTLDDRFDPAKAQEIVEHFTKKNEKYLKRKLGRDPNKTELYLAHFSGMGGANKILQALKDNPDADSSSIYSEKAISDNIFLKGKTVSDIYNWAADKVKEDHLETSHEKEKVEKYRDETEYPTQQIDNTRVVGIPMQNIPDSTVPNYTVPEGISKEKASEKQDQGISQDQLKAILQKERSAVEQQFLEAYKRGTPAQEPVQIEAAPSRDLYQFVDPNVESYLEEGGEHKVKQGDSLSKIAKMNGMSLEEVLEYNSSYKENPNMVRVGDTIKLGRSKDSPEKFKFSKSREIKPTFFPREVSSTYVKSKRVQNPPQVKDKKIDLDNLTNIDEVKRAQRILQYSGYNIGENNPIDGKLGPKTKKALIEYKENMKNRKTKGRKDVGNNIQNSIPLAARQFIYDSFGGEEELNETSLSDEDYDALKGVVLKNIEKDKMKVDYEDWRQAGAGGEDTRNDDMNLLNPYSNLQKTLGQASIKVNKSGDIYVEDSYNFNDAGDKKNRYKNKHTDDEGLLPINKENTFSNNIYRIARNYKTEHGKKDGGSPVNIFIGNVSDIF